MTLITSDAASIEGTRFSFTSASGTVLPLSSSSTVLSNPSGPLASVIHVPPSSFRLAYDSSMQDQAQDSASAPIQLLKKGVDGGFTPLKGIGLGNFVETGDRVRLEGEEYELVEVWPTSTDPSPMKPATTFVLEESDDEETQQIPPSPPPKPTITITTTTIATTATTAAPLQAEEEDSDQERTELDYNTQLDGTQLSESSDPDMTQAYDQGNDLSGIDFGDETQRILTPSLPGADKEREEAEGKRLKAEAERKETEEAERLAREKQEAELKARLGAERLAEEARVAEAKRKEEEARVAEENHVTRIAEEARITEEERVAEEKRLAEEERVAKEKRLAEKARIVEEARIAEEDRMAEEEKVAEEKRLAKEVLIAEEKRIATEKAEGEPNS